MTDPLPNLMDDQKQKLVEELEAMGLLRRDAHGRRWLTERGSYIGMALYAFCDRIHLSEPRAGAPLSKPARGLPNPKVKY
jgi:hypothetical protein